MRKFFAPACVFLWGLVLSGASMALFSSMTFRLSHNAPPAGACQEIGPCSLGVWETIGFLLCFLAPSLGFLGLGIWGALRGWGMARWAFGAALLSAVTVGYYFMIYAI